MYLRRIISAATVVAGAMLLSCSIARGTVMTNQLVITEHSSTSLTATLNGSALTVTAGAADHWTITLPNGDVLRPVTEDWLEPNGSSSANSVTGNSPNDTISVISDVPGVSTGFTNGATDTTDFGIGLFNGGIQPVDVTFNDNGDSPRSVPEATSTVALLSLALGGLGIVAKRKKAVRMR